jgi:hypothetical protein
MEVLVIQPPASPAVVLDQTGGRVSHIAPPWHATCMLSYLRQRTRHTGRIFDARVRPRWADDLPVNLATKLPVNIVAVYCGIHDVEAAKKIVMIVRRAQPELPVVVFGEAPTMNPSSFRAMIGADFGIAGDPEPTLRQLLDNFHLASRRQRISGLAQDGSDQVLPFWAVDLKTLALPNWADVSLPYYDSPAYPGGGRANVCMSRGADAHPVGALERSDGAPLRISTLDRCIEILQDCSHIGIMETFFADPPDVWDSNRLVEWLARLARINNSQDWSLRLLALPVGESFRKRLVDQSCRRIELLVPSCDPGIAARFGYELPDPREMNAMTRWFQDQGTAIDFVFWVGGPDEPRGEASRINGFMRQFRNISFALVARPDISPAEPRLPDIARDVRRRMALSPMRRIANIYQRIKQYSATIDDEHREFVVKPRALPQSITGETNFQSLEKKEEEVSNDWKK